MKEQTCTKCAATKPLSPDFWHRARRGRLRTICKICMRDYYLNRSQTKTKRRENCRLENSAEWICHGCKQSKPRTPDFWPKNSSKKDGLGWLCKPCNVAWVRGKKRPGPGRKPRRYTKADISKRYRDKPRNRLSNRISCRMRHSIRENKSGNRWEKLVGYTLDELMAHLEAQFPDGMGWHNMNEWHIDHRLPIASFSFSSPEDEDFKRCWALENLQPLWARENLKKNSKIIY